MIASMLRLLGFVLGAAILTIAQDTKKEEIVLPTSAEDLATGKKLYDGSCQLCHGPQGDGGKGANLAVPKLARAATDSDLARIIEVGIPGTEMPGAYHMVKKEITQVAAYVKTFAKFTPEKVPGDPAKGRAVYLGKGGCQACHTTTGADGLLVGGLTGPDLSTIGGRRSAAHLRESIVDPSASIPDYFVDTTAVLANGQRINGRRLTEDTFYLVIHDYQGRNHVIDRMSAREIIKDRKKTPMPSYKGKLSADELDNLIAFLVSLRETK